MLHGEECSLFFHAVNFLTDVWKYLKIFHKTLLPVKEKNSF